MRRAKWLMLSFALSILLLQILPTQAIAQDGGNGKYASGAPSPAQGWPIPPGHYGLLAGYADNFLINASAPYAISWATLTGPDNPAKLDQLDEFFILDVRSAASYTTKHLVGAVNIPYAQVAQHLVELPLDKPILIVCQTGLMSGQVGAILGILGYEMRILSGGMSAVVCSATTCTP